MDLAQCRDEINSIDNDLLDLLAKRREIVRAVIRTKFENDLPLRDQVREADLLDRLIRDGRKVGLDVHFVTRVFHEIIEDSVRYQGNFLQKSLNPAPDKFFSVAFQGVQGAYSHLAAEKFFAEHLDHCTIEGYKTFADVVAAVENGQADCALLPIENTTAGSINAVYDLLLGTKLSIVGEEVFSVQHCLLAPEKVSLSKIERVFSHYQALAQCSEFLGRLKNCEQQTYVDTADSARKVAEDGDPAQAAIASEEAARIYGLRVLKRNLANHAENYTRFVVVAQRPGQVDERVPCKTSLVISTSHREGELFKALSIFDEHKINLTKLESRPMQGSPFTYLFYLDFEGNANDPQMQDALVSLSAATSYLRILGSYPRQRHDRTKPRVQSKLAEIPDESGEESIDTAAIAVQGAAAQGTGESNPTLLRANTDGRLVDRATRPDDTQLRIRDLEIGGDHLVVLAGPEQVTSKDQLHTLARDVSEYGGGVLRAGCLEPSLSAYRSRRVDPAALEALVDIGREFGLPISTVVESVSDVEAVARAVDIVEVGARNMQNFGLLEEVGKTGCPVILTRGPAASFDDFLEAAECILAHGNQQVLLCERGSRGAENSETDRTTLDLGNLAMLRERTHLPIVADPCHAVERESLIGPLATAARAFGAHAIILRTRRSGIPASENPLDAKSLEAPAFARLLGELFGASKK